MHRQLLLLVVASSLAACPEPTPPTEDAWELVHRGLSGALLSVWGTSSRDVWAVGGDALDGTGPTVIHFDGESWSRVPTGESQGNLWWVFGFDEGPVYMGGEGGVILRYEDGDYTLMDTPGTETVFGIWGATPDDVWAVGGASDASGGFAWRLSGDAWIPEPSLPAEVTADSAVWKVFGTTANDAHLVGSNGVALHWDGASLQYEDTGVGSSLFTVHAKQGRYAAVGGGATGIILEYEGDAWTNVTPTPPPPGLSGVVLGDDGLGVAVGAFGAVFTRSDAGGWAEEDLGFNLAHTLHAAWIDDEGCMWAVGGQVYSPPFDEGVMIHRGPSIPSEGL
ncbi:hypothetical protein ENSA5_27720 [Enhygromyxa salina]|uniref:BNR repeat domain protein n=1 Tax=Enhygromyxa salina TaxID=215803 RepID=A0A2S9Y7K5_9BACT|nr:hypothetical protein [Enhygromyxa salina]PRQ01090.1 hypothetical protein ENSA5_27720 [Enhygromyxa salina]